MEESFTKEELKSFTKEELLEYAQQNSDKIIISIDRHVYDVTSFASQVEKALKSFQSNLFINFACQFENSILVAETAL